MTSRRVTYNQLESLWEFLNAHRDIATGYNKTAQARQYSKMMWQRIAAALNSQGEGAEKDWRGWSKYWNDFKSKLKGKVAASRMNLRRTGGGPGLSTAGQLTELDLKFLQILGEGFGAGIPGARVEPFDDPTAYEARASELPIHVATESQGGSESILINIPLVPETQYAEALVQPSTSRVVPETPATLTPSTTSPMPARAGTTPLSSSGSPRRRRRIESAPVVRSPRAALRSPHRRIRRRRREPTMPIETARLTLIKISEERAAEEKRRNDILENILNEMINIREMINSRFPVELPSTDVLEQP